MTANVMVVKVIVMIQTLSSHKNPLVCPQKGGTTKETKGIKKRERRTGAAKPIIMRD